MNCKDVLELSCLYLSGELEAPRSARVRLHLDACPACAGEMGRLADVDARVREVLLAEPADTSVIERNVRETIRPSRRWIAVAAAMAAVIVIGLAVRTEFRPDPICLDAAVDHRDEVVNGAPRKWRTDENEIAQLAAKQGVSIPQLVEAGYRVERGKVCRLTGKPYLHVIVSDSAGSEMSLFLSPGDGAAPVRTLDSGAEHVAYFGTGRIRAIVVANRSIESVKQLAKLVEQRL